MNSNFKGPMTGTPLPGVSKKIRKLLLAREEVAEMIERLIAILDEIDGGAELEPSGDEDEPTLGWPAGVTRVAGFNDGRGGRAVARLDRHRQPGQSQPARRRRGLRERRQRPGTQSRLASMQSGALMAGRDRTGDQSSWADGDNRDFEDEHDGSEEDCAT